ncbi:helix-turn-helix domain-containing protein [Embleya sp. NPDC059237]|uniref:helix-turn-helix domain-containing protein n=1 Tax=Embleya sp. NPDC059237 TaxID=3346784 RepID=UPI0036CD56F3
MTPSPTTAHFGTTGAHHVDLGGLLGGTTGMPHDSFAGAAGTRIAAYRQVRHLSQKGLAAKANISYSLLTKVETGALPASPSMIAACARALSVDVATLTAQPYMHELRQDRLDALINPIREALDLYDIGADEDTTPRDLAELEADAEELCRLVRAGDLRTVGTELPGLIAELTATVHAAPTAVRERSYAVLASAYRTAYDVTTKLGYHDLCGVALDRMEWAAQRASDPVLVAIRQYLRALAYLRSGRYERGARLLVSGHRILEDADREAVETIAVKGQIHLGGAVLAARAHDRDTAEAELAQARRAAARTGDVPQVHWLSFGPVNVSMHEVSAQAELDRYDQAITVASKIQLPGDWPKSRVAHHHCEVARAQSWVGENEGAFRSLLLARKAAPQQTRHHPVVHETVSTLVAARRRAPDTLTSFAHWIGM